MRLLPKIVGLILGISTHAVLNSERARAQNATNSPTSSPTGSPVTPEPSRSPTQKPSVKLVTESPTPKPTNSETTAQCFGPDNVEQLDVNPSMELTDNVCLVATLALDDVQDEKYFRVQLTFDDLVVGEDDFALSDPDFNERVLCHAVGEKCQLCLGFTDAFVGEEEWANICPRWISTCVDGPTPEYTSFTDCVFIGNQVDVIPEIVKGNTNFALNLLSTNILTETNVSDLFVSPFGITNALMFPLMAAEHNTRAQIIAAFGLQKAMEGGNKQFYDSYTTLVQSLQHDDALVRSSVNNRLWISNLWFSELNPAILSDFQRFGDIKGVNFHNDSAQATEAVNEYVSDKSSHLITDAILGKGLSPQTVLVFTDVMYLDTQWMTPFGTTINETFFDDAEDEHHHDHEHDHDDDDDFKGHVVTMMSAVDAKVKYYESNDDSMQFEVITIPFKQEFSSFSFVVMRVTEEKYIKDGPKDTIELEKHLTAEKLRHYLKSSLPKTMDLQLPMFKGVYNRQDVTQSLISLGVSDLYDPQKCDMRNLTKERYQVYDDELDRYDYLTISQQGIQIGSLATDGNGKEVSKMSQIKHADRPFLFFVMDSTLDLVLYAGRVTNPKGWCLNDCPSDDDDDDKSGSNSAIGFLTALIIILSVGLVSYYVIRWIYNVRVLGLRGSEAVPHIALWKKCSSCLGNGYQALVGEQDQGAAPRRRRNQDINGLGRVGPIEEDEDLNQNHSNIRYQEMESDREDNVL